VETLIRYAHERIDDLEQVMLSVPEALIDLPLTHRFTPGLYTREIYLPAGTLVTSKVHRTEHQYVVLSGRLSIFIPEMGGDIQHVEGPFVGTTHVGTRRVVYVHTDTRFLTIHANVDDCRDMDVLNALLCEDDMLGVNAMYRSLLSQNSLKESTDDIR